MADLPEQEVWDGVYQLETSDRALGGLGGVMNKPLRNLTNRTSFLKKTLEEKTGEATTLKMGIVKLNSAINSNSETDASTPKAVKAAYDLAQTASGNVGNKLSKSANLNDIADASQARINLGLQNALLGPLSQVVGDNDNLVMSQKGITAALNEKQAVGNYADGNIFAVGDTETNVFNPNKNLYFLCNNSNVSGVASIQYGMIWGFDGAGRLTVGKVPTSQIEGIVQTTGPSIQNLMSQKATTEAINATASVGVNQTWMNMTASRIAGVNYTNTTGRPICAILNIKNTITGLWASNITVSGLEISTGSAIQGEHRSIFVVIPNGAVYSYNPLASSGSAMWELR